MRPKPTNRKAGEDDVPANIREGRAVERTDRRINELNKTGMSPEEKLRALLEDD